MTMRLDIVTNDAGEGVRREHARELGAGVVIAIYRLTKLAQLHDLTNQAFTRQLEQTHQIIGDYCLRSGSNVNVMFAHKAVFVAGQLLKGSRGTYEAATELGDLFERLGGSELHIQRDITRAELLSFAEQISNSYRSAAPFRSTTPKVRLRAVGDAARLRGLELETLSEDQRIVRMYASAVVIMRRFYEDLQASRYILPRRIKRIAQSLVDLSEGSTPAFLGVTEVRNANFDEAGRAVNTAILAVAMAREVTQDRATLSQIAMAGMMHDVARPRAMALSQAAVDPSMPGMQGPSMLSEDQEDRLAAGAVAVLTALGRVNEPSITRTVLTFEALWLRRETWLGPVYWGARAPTLHAKLIAIARRYNDLLTPEPGLIPPTPDYAVASLSEELTDAQDRTVLRMLVSALGLLPLGTVVQLSTGEVAEVTRGPRGPGERARVCLMTDAAGQPLAAERCVELELSQEPNRQVARIVSVEGWRKGRDLLPADVNEAYGDERDSSPPALASASRPAPSPASPPPASRGAPSVPSSHAPSVPSSHAPSVPSSRAPSATSSRAPSAPSSRAPSAPLRAPVAPAAPAEGSEGARDREEESVSLASASVESGERSAGGSIQSIGSTPSAVAGAMGRMLSLPADPSADDSSDSEPTLFRPGPVAGPRDSTGLPNAAPAREPTARGNLGATPLPHVLVYMLDHSLTGTVVFRGGAGEEVITFESGVPIKVRLHDEVALLGQILVQGGALGASALEQAAPSARLLGVLLGEYLVGHDMITREALAWALEVQLLDKVAYLANLAPEIVYAYYRDVDLLAGWGGGGVRVGCALNPILASVRNWTDRARVRATLNRIGKHPLALHEDCVLSSLALLPEEQATLDMMRSESIPLAQLFARNVADEDVVSSLVYTFAVTRQFAFKGQKKGPMAARTGSPWPAPAGSGPPVPVDSIPVEAAPSVKPAAPEPNVSAARVDAQASRPPSTPPQAASAPPSGIPGPGPRVMQPAVRPVGAPRANAPQIRPMTARKATIVGIPPPAAPARRAAAGPTAGAPPAVPSPADVDDGLAEATRALEAMRSFRLAEAALQRNDLSQAEKLAQVAAENDPTQADYVALLAWVRVLGAPSPRSGTVLDEALATMTELLADAPSSERVRLYRGKLLALGNRLPEAIAELEALVAANPQHREADSELRLLRSRR